MTGVDPLNCSAYSAISIDESIIYRATLSLSSTTQEAEIVSAGDLFRKSDSKSLESDVENTTYVS